jgi:RNA polymerase sigma-70 factor, ECF subfamily
MNRESEASEPFLSTADLRGILERRLPQLRAFVRVRAGQALRTREPVSDLVQSTVRQALDDVAGTRFCDEAEFVGWMYRVATSKLISKSRFHGAGRREVGREQELATRVFEFAARERSSISPSPSAVATRNEDLDRLEAALDELDDVDREIVSLHHFFGAPTREIAALVRRPESTVRWRLARAIARLASRLR